MADIILSPKPGDPDRAEDLLDEIQGVLQKRGACLIHKPDCMVLAVADPMNGNWRAIAQVKLIAAKVSLMQKYMDWRPVSNDASRITTPKRRKQ